MEAEDGAQAVLYWLGWAFFGGDVRSMISIGKEVLV